MGFRRRLPRLRPRFRRHGSRGRRRDRRAVARSVPWRADGLPFPTTRSANSKPVTGSEKAIEFGIFAEVHHRRDIPRRTDLGDLPTYRTHKHHLFGAQEGHCGGCRMASPFRNFEVDHVIPRAKGGSDHIDNLQLLCGACNRAKGTSTQAELIAKLKERGHLAA